MPVLKIYFSRIQRMSGLSRERVLDRLPYLGLDIEGTDDESVRIEYNPNRPDFSTDYGVARALVGLVGKETGVPEYRVSAGRGRIIADRSLAKVRPYIAGVVARRIRLDDETIRQLISMQEDLHNGLGRKRRKVAIGLHDLEAVGFPVRYSAKAGDFAFAPLGSNEEMTVAEILARTETGRAYGHILAGTEAYPMLIDSTGTVLSFPPIINGQKTKVGKGTRGLFVDVTSTDQRLGDEALAIVSCALADAGATLESVTVSYARTKVVTPDLTPARMKFDLRLAGSLTGLSLSKAEASDALRKSRLDVDPRGFAVIPRYRVDILHPVDLAEEVVIGYGLDKMTPVYPPSGDAGRYDRGLASVDAMSLTMAEAGYNETMSFDLVDDATLYRNFGRSSEARLEVDNPRTAEHSLLRDSLLPSLMAVLGRNTKNEYPQRVYEVGTVFRRSGGRVVESTSLAALSAHSSSSFTEAKMHLEALVRRQLGEAAETRPAGHWAFAEGRCAEVVVKGVTIGHVGEVKPGALAAFGLGVGVCGFELGLKPRTRA
ncbi:MAG: phenylalanine--tRNA ligase subunit beta [Nitrososphaerota archaeon]|nr:phenylalanine--tRNA ligase subunit beta [Nitrososphaerota archaeon]MDG6966267.1 phenylalanine--tRNA ligase subunit beta [Nitrososphaerota archaeon]MDG6977702.1 phenylalanine--tRNA ligase subunit beta [Nitrososphaerota archaeon]